MPKPSGEPFQDMCTMVGLMTITWAWAENALALSIGAIDEKFGPMHGHSQLPIALQKRLSYLRAALRDVSALETFKQDGAALIKLFVELRERRNDLVHGSIWLMPHDAFESLRMTIKGRQHSGQQKSIQIGDVVRFNGQVENLAHAAAMFLRRIDEAFF